MSPARWPPPPPGTGGWLAVRCQDLPPQAFVHPAVGLGLFAANKVAAFSYARFTREHPDPSGFHSLAFARALQRRDDIKAFFWDFLSLPQAYTKGGFLSDEERIIAQNGLNGDDRQFYPNPLTFAAQRRQLKRDAVAPQ